MEPTAAGYAVYNDIETAIREYFRASIPGSDTRRGAISHSVREWPGEGKRRFVVLTSSGEAIEVTLEQVK